VTNKPKTRIGVRMHIGGERGSPTIFPVASASARKKSASPIVTTRRSRVQSAPSARRFQS